MGPPSLDAPRSQRNLLAPGSTLFCTVDEPAELQEGLASSDGLLLVRAPSRFRFRIDGRWRLAR